MCHTHQIYHLMWGIQLPHEVGNVCCRFSLSNMVAAGSFVMQLHKNSAKFLVKI